MGIFGFADNTVMLLTMEMVTMLGTMLKYVKVFYGGGTSNYGAINVTNSRYIWTMTVKFSIMV